MKAKSPKPKEDLLEERAIQPRDLKLLADPTREFIYQALVSAPRTATELAQLMDCPTTRLYHHLKLLEKHGLIRVVAERLVSGIVERRYRAVAKRLRLDRASFGAEPPGGDPLQTILGYVFDRAREDIERSHAAGRIDLALRPPQPGALLAYRNVLKLTPADRDRLCQRLHDLYLEYERISAATPPETGEFHGIALAAYPTELAPAETTRPGSAPTRKRPGGSKP
ncbi:MAG: helix-turn-helix transcriptional regulator [Rhodanobacteraceae bacterium]|nr:helix-turn-helix transcriptional regulator [Rhodanobacteraceae bacterium]